MHTAGQRRIFFGATTGLPMPAEAPPKGHLEIQAQEHARLYGQVVGARVLAIPGLAGILLWIAIEESATWRRGILFALVLVASAFFVVEAIRYRRRGFTRDMIPLNLGAAVIGPLIACFASGGLASPILYVIVPVGILVGVFLGPPLAWILVGLQIASVWGFALLGASGTIADFNLSAFGGGARVGGPPGYLYAHAAGITFVLLMAGQLGRVIRRVFESIIRRALSAQEESLKAHAERAQELTALSARSPTS